MRMLHLAAAHANEVRLLSWGAYTNSRHAEPIGRSEFCPTSGLTSTHETENEVQAEGQPGIVQVGSSP